MERVSARPRARRRPSPASENAMNQIIRPTLPPTTDDRPPPPRPEIIAIRKTCDAEGTGLSHYVLMDKRVTR